MSVNVKININDFMPGHDEEFMCIICNRPITDPGHILVSAPPENPAEDVCVHYECENDTEACGDVIAYRVTDKNVEHSHAGENG